jgi:hypothetical protein
VEFNGIVLGFNVFFYWDLKGFNGILLGFI